MRKINLVREDELLRFLDRRVVGARYVVAGFLLMMIGFLVDDAKIGGGIMFLGWIIGGIGMYRYMVGR